MKRIRQKPVRFSFPAFGKAVFLVVSVLLFIALVYSVAASGLRYQFDIDEFYFSQYAYLYAHGLRPYLDVYSSVYPPVFAWLITPAFWLNGFTFDGIAMARVLMIGFLAIRLIFSYLAVQTIFSKRVALLFLPLFLLDPFAVFTTMQIRPDNVMLTFFSAGLYFFSRGFIRPDKKYLAAGGILLSLSVLTLPKIAPTMIILGSGFALYCLVRRKLPDLLTFMIAACIPVTLFCFYLLLTGSFSEMIMQTFVDIKSVYTNFVIPIPINAMMRPDNLYVFGTGGKPPSWVYLWMIAPLGIAGAYLSVRQTLVSGEFTPRRIIAMILAVSMIAQWGILFTLQVVFLQHYMPFHWIAVLFMAIVFDDVLTVTAKQTYLYGVTVAILSSMFFIVTTSSIANNISRSTITSAAQVSYYESRWKEIPQEEAVFPGLLFRPLSYPLPYGGFIINLPKVVIDRLPPIATILEQKKPRLLLDDYTLFRLPESAQLYINAHYSRIDGDTELMKVKP